MARAVLRITLPLVSDEPVRLSDATALFAELVRLAIDAGWWPEDAHCDYEGVEP